MKLEATSIEDALTQLKRLMDYAPYRFGGIWFISQLDDSTVLMFRTKKAIVSNLRKKNKAGLNTIFKVGK